MNPQSTLVVICGASNFPKARKLAAGRAFYNSAADFQEYIQEKHGLGIPERNVLWLFDDSKSSGDQLDAIESFLQTRISELDKEGASAQEIFFYYVGHGLFDQAGRNYCLAIRSTNENNEGGTSIRGSDLAKVLKEQAAFLRRYLIIDCCFAASLYSLFQSGPLNAAVKSLQEDLPLQGTTLLCSSNARDVSLVAESFQRTMFSDALISVLRRGHPKLGPKLSFIELGVVVKEYLRNTYKDAAVRPEVLSPDQRDGDLAGISIFPNAAYLTVDDVEVHPPKVAPPRTTDKREEPPIAPSVGESVQTDDPDSQSAIDVQESQNVIPVPPLAKARRADPLVETVPKRKSEPPEWDSPRLPGMERNFDEELSQIETSRGLRLAWELPRPAAEQSLIGLALSGGGVRSATFNLGVLQAFARRRLLRKFDYLSTVSGGGYIGSWLMAWMYNQEIGIQEVEHRLGLDADPPEVKLLRDRNFFVPRRALLSFNSLPFVTSYLANTMLNQIILLMALLSLLLVPRTIVYLLHVLEELEKIQQTRPFFALQQFMRSEYFALALGLILGLVGVIYVGLNLGGKRDPWYANSWAVYALIIAPWLVSSALFTYACGLLLTDWRILDHPEFRAPLLGIGLYFNIWIGVYLVMRIVHFKNRAGGNGAVGGLGIVTAAMTGALIGYLFVPFGRLLIPTDTSQHLTYSNWHNLTFGTPALIFIMLIAGVVHIGLMGRGIGAAQREWWGRLGGLLMLSAISWLALFLISIYFPPELGRLLAWEHGDHRTILSAVVLWTLSTAYGVFYGKSEKGIKWNPDSSVANKMLALAAKVTPYIFILGLLLGLSIFASFAANWAMGLRWPTLALPSDLHFEIGAPVLCLVFFTAALLVSSRVDINESSLHHLYRDPLVRTYLGASVADLRDQFTPQSSKNGDFPLATLVIPPESVDPADGRPLPILNASLISRSGTSSVMQSTEIQSFTFTPTRSGFTRRLTGEKEWESSYAFTRLAGARTGDSAAGITLGTVLALSGGTSNPKALYYSSTPFAFLMKLFDVRPGRWVGNPVRERWWSQGSPRSGFSYLLRELLGTTDDRSAYLTLSDGGLFENLGIYELVRRRCRLIVASDASYDPLYNFDDLRNAMERCRTDFGVEIVIDTYELVGSDTSRRAGAQFAVGKIRYSKRAPEQDGILIYLKPTLIAADRATILAFARSNPEFPQESSATHEFDRTRFESYRTLGEGVGVAASEAIEQSVRELIS